MTVTCVFCKHTLHVGEKYKVMRGEYVCVLCVNELNSYMTLEVV